MAESAGVLNHIRGWMRSPSHDGADACLMLIVDELFRSEEDDSTPEFLMTSLDALSALARMTWWSCPCDAVDPTSGLVDAFCPKCHALRHLPQRLSFPVWTAYILAARRLFPQTWFDKLERWSRQKNLLAQPRGGVAGENASPAEGVASYDGVAGIDAKGDTSPSHQIKTLVYIDNMRVLSRGETHAANWIALPLPSLDEFSQL